MAERPVKRKYDATSRRAAAAATRDRICAAAEELFVRDGYARTSIRAVARAAGVAEATIYLTFPNKAALLDAVIIRAIRDNPSETLATIAAAPPAEVLARVAASNALLMARAGLTTIVLVFAETAQRLHTRNPFASGGVYEDPATGAATAALAGYLRDIGWPHGGAIDVVQGEDMGMLSRLHADISPVPGSSIRVSGTARIMRP